MDPESSIPSGDGYAGDFQATPQRRKRAFESTNLDVSNGENKSRRTTPVRNLNDAERDALWSSGGRSGSKSMDYIDLTVSSDDEIDAESLALQVEAENRARKQREQQQADRALALRMSQSSDQPSSSQTSSTPVQSDAFDRIMTAQRLNSQQPSLGGSMQSPYNGMGEQQPNNVALPSTYSLPGSYEPSWDLPAPFLTPEYPTGNPLAYQQASASRVNTSGNTAPSAFDMSPGEIGAVFSIDPYPTTSQYGESSSSSRRQPPIRNGFDTLSAIINRTNSYDFVNGVDGLGNPLSSEINDYVNRVVHDSKLDAKEIDDLLANIRPDMAIPETNREGTPEGLKGALYRHQEIALTWLKDMEEGTNKGGILADDMGLGKTISMLALILARPAKSKPKTNLIIGPLSLLKQWEEEILSKIKRTHSLSIFVYHGGKKNNVTTEDLLKYDIVLTTYMTLAAQNKRLEVMVDKAKETGRPINFDEKAVITRIPLLHPKARFYRIILDEAQCVKNVKTQSAQAVHGLRAMYRWCLSGTPMMNSVEELFSLICFLKIKPYCTWQHFKNHFGALFGKGGEYTQTRAMNRLRTVLKAIMLRRKKDSTIEGKPILQLPPKTEQIVNVDLSQDERSFYNSLETKSRVIFNKYLREGSVGKNYTNILVLLLRLRQACCHPHLNLDVEDRALNSDEDMLQMVKGLNPSIVTRIKGMDAFECPICYDPIQSPCFFVPCGHDSCTSCLASLVDTSLTQSIQAGMGDAGDANATCPVCRGQFDPTKCFTYEAFQKVHEPEKVKQERSNSEEDEDDDVDGYSTESSSSDWYKSDDEVDNKGNLKGFIVDDEIKFDTSEEDDKPKLPGGPQSERKPPPVLGDDTKQLVKSEAEAFPEASDSSRKAKKGKRKSKGKAKAEDITADVKPSMLKSLRKEAVKNRTAYKKYMAYLRKTWLPSAKVTECLKLLQTIQEAGEKTIVFSQWTSLLDLVEIGMKHEGLLHQPVRYDGGMSAKERNNSAVKFRSSNTANVILVSLKAGNAGLNLAAASRVIILDPFWNPYIEMQAVDRAYRIGQQREVQVYRILSNETVEDRIISLQERKKSMIESAMDENEGRKISRLTVGELRYLFNGD